MFLVRRASRVVALVLACSLAGAAGARASCAGLGAGASYAAGTSPQMVVSADFDGDGVADLAVANLSGSALAVMRGLGGGAFASPVTYAGGTAGRGLAVSDFNGDGIADLAVCVSDGVMIWRGVGDGTFTGGTEVMAGSANRAVACADFDGDGIVDLAVSSSSTNAVLVLHGNGSAGIGDGTFAAPASYAVSASPARIVAADLDGDGIIDLAVANNGSGCIAILRGHGVAGRPDGTFYPAALYAAAGSPWDIAVLDWNRDGVPDLVVSDGAGTTLTLLRGTGAGAFASAGSVTTPTAPRDLVVGDFDGDGIADVATACAAANVVSVLRGTGSGLVPFASFAAGPGATGLVAGDWNADGAADLASANPGGASITRFLATCPPAVASALTLIAPLGGESWWPGTRQPVRWARSGSVTAVDADLSRDGGRTWVPLARREIGDHVWVPAVGAPDARLRVRVRDALVPARAAASPADFTLCAVLGAPLVSEAALTPTRLVAGDLDGDGLLDVVACDAAHAVVLRGDGAGHFTAGTPFAADSTRELRLADVNGDAVPDLVRLSPTAVALRMGDGAGGFGPETTLPVAGGVGLVVCDLDADGLPDFAVLAADGANSRLVVWRSTVPGMPWTAAVAGAPAALAGADFDGDGILDLALACGGGVQLWSGGGRAGRGDGTFLAGPARSLPSAPGDLAAADLDADGLADVLACLPASGDLMRLPVIAASGLVPAGGIAAPQAIAAGASPRRPVIVDLDGDGRADIALVLAGEGTLEVLLHTEAGFAAPLRFADGTCGPAVVVGDFTRDGNPDLVVAGTDGRVRCLPAQCPPQLPATLALAAAGDTSAAAIGFTRTFAWQRSASVGAVRVELSRDGGAHWTVLADALAGSTFAWAVSGPPTSAARVRVSDAACGARFDESPVFSIHAPLAPVRASVAPAGGTAFACADLDGDGAPDAVVADSAGVHVLRGDGSGGFVALADFAGRGVQRVRVLDLDGDGVPDLLTLSSDGVTLRRGTGRGSFGAPQFVAVAGGAADAGVGDFDEDGLPDLAIACGGDAPHVTVLSGRGVNGDGTFGWGYPGAVSLSAAPTAMAIADVDGDGILDLVIAQRRGLDVDLGTGSNGHGNGGFRLASRRTFGGDVRELLAGDFDGDGRVDLAALNRLSNTLLVAAGDGAGGFATPATLALPADPAGEPVAADIDHDGAVDFVVPLAGGDVALVRGIPGAPTATRFALAARVPTGGAGGPLALLDADGDGVEDAIVLDGTGTLRVLRAGLGAAGAPRLAPGIASPARVGDELAVAWTQPVGVLAVDVELSRDGGQRWTPVARGISGGAWRWSVTGPATAEAKLRVRDASVPARPDTAGVDFDIEPAVTSVGAPAGGAASLRLAGANPSRAGVRLALTLPRAGAARVDVCDVSGRRVRTLADGLLPAGTHALHWDGRDDAGTLQAPGLYFVRARAGTINATARVVLTR